MNPILSMIGGGGGMSAILMQAVGAAMRGETPEAFLKTLAQTNPQLRGVDLTDLEGAARKIANAQGKDLNAMAGDVKAMVNKLM